MYKILNEGDSKYVFNPLGTCLEDSSMAEIEANHRQETNQQKVPFQADSTCSEIYIQTIRTGAFEENQGHGVVRNRDWQVRTICKGVRSYLRSRV